MGILYLNWIYLCSSTNWIFELSVKSQEKNKCDAELLYKFINFVIPKTWTVLKYSNEHNLLVLIKNHIIDKKKYWKKHNSKPYTDQSKFTSFERKQN